MKKLILALAFLLAGAANAFGQSTTVSGQVTDSGGQTWNNGTFTATFVPNPNFPVGPYTWTGGALNQVITGTMNGSGAYSVSIPSNSAITPVGSQWIFQFVANATSNPFSTAKTTITGATQTLNATPPDISINLQNPPGPFTTAYADDEIATPVPQGAEYFNTTSLLTRVWNGSAWNNQGTGGGGVTPCGGAANTQVAFFTAPTTLCGDPNFTWTTATHIAVIAGGLDVFGLALSSSVIQAGAGQSNFISIGSTGDGVNGDQVQIKAFNTAASQINLFANGSMLIKSTNSFIALASTNMNNTAGELDLGGTVAGAGVLGLVGNTSGTCTDTVDATSTTVASNCAFKSTGGVGITSFLSAGLNVMGVSGTGGTNVISLTALAVGGTVLIDATQGININSTNASVTVGVVGSNPTVFGLVGNSDGVAATLTGPATAATRTNPVVSSNYLSAPVLVSTVAIGTAPFTVTSTTNVPNLNASSLGGATFAAPGTIGGTTPGIGDFSALNCGVLNTTACVLTGFGSTSGTATFTWPTVAGTSTNAVVSSNVIQGPVGSNASPTFQLGANEGMYDDGGGDLTFNTPSGKSIVLRFNGATSYNITPTELQVLDSVTAIGDASHHFTSLFLTNCSAVGTGASPSLVACGAATTGAFSCATNASAATCVISTTAVNANSDIIVTENSSEGTRLSVTCNTAPTVEPPMLLASRITGTSFTINMPTITVNPACFVYHIIN